MAVINDLGAVPAGVAGGAHEEDSQPSNRVQRPSQRPFLLPAEPKVHRCTSPEWAQGFLWSSPGKDNLRLQVLLWKLPGAAQPRRSRRRLGVGLRGVGDWARRGELRGRRFQTRCSHSAHSPQLARPSPAGLWCFPSASLRLPPKRPDLYWSNPPSRSTVSRAERLEAGWSAINH